MNTNDRRILAVIGLVAGLLSLVTWLLPICGALVAISAVILGFLSRHSSRRKIAIVGMITGTIGLVLAIGSDAVIIYQQYTGQSSGTPVSEVVKEELVTVERAAFAQRYPDLVISTVDVEFRDRGRLLPQDQEEGVTMLMCYQTSITYRTADGSCQGGDLRHGILALVDGQWEYEKYVQIDFDTWAEHSCGDFALEVRRGCLTATPVP
jgi:hypothetical protein